MTEKQEEYTAETKAIETVRFGTIEAAGPDDVIVKATSMASRLSKIITDQNLYTVISGRKYVNVEGWNTLGAMLGILPREVSVVEHDNGDFEATVELIRASDGQVVGRASSIVGEDEHLWANRPRYARRSMSVTRATGKAFRLGFSWIIKLAGYEPTPAEEMAEVTDGSYREVSKVEIAKEQKSETTKDERPYKPEVLKEKLHVMTQHVNPASDKQRKLLVILLGQQFSDDDLRHDAQEFLFGARSLNDVDGRMINAALKWLDPSPDSGGAYVISDIARKELSAVQSAFLISKGQQRMGDILNSVSE